MHNSKSVDTPIKNGYTLSWENCPKSDEKKIVMARVPYASVIRSLIYAMLCTWADICFAIGLDSCCQSHPKPICWQAIRHFFVIFGRQEILFFTIRVETWDWRVTLILVGLVTKMSVNP